MVLLSLKMLNSYQKKNKRVKPPFLPCPSLSISLVQMGQYVTLQWKKLNGLEKVCRILWSKEKGNKELWFTVLSVPLWASFYWLPLESVYRTSRRFYWLSPVVFSPVEIITLQKAGWQFLLLHFRELKKNPKRSWSNIVAFFNEKNGNDISSNMQLDKGYRHHSDENTEHPVSSYKHQHKNCLQNHRAGNHLKKLPTSCLILTIFTYPALKGCTSVISDRRCSNLF